MRSGFVVAVVMLAGCSKDSPPATAAPASGVQVQLPRARSGAEAGAVAQVTIAEKGQAFVNGVAVADDEALTAKLRELRTQTPSIELHLLSEPGVTYARIVTVLDAIRQAGVVNVSFDSTQAPKPDAVPAAAPAPAQK